MASLSEDLASEAPSPERCSDGAQSDGAPKFGAHSWWRGLRWRSGLFVVASLLGCQAMAASRQITAPVVVMMPEGIGGARESFLQGLALGEQDVRACGGEPTPMVIHALGSDGDPLVLFPRDAKGLPLLPPLLVAPYAADLRSYSQLTERGETRVLLGHQRGPSLDTLGSLDEQGRLWPLLPSRQDDLRALAKGAMDRGWKRVVVVSDPTSLEGDRASRFVEMFEGLGGKVLSYTQDQVQELDGSDPERFALLEKDLDWLGPDAVVLAAPPTSKLAIQLTQRQRDQRYGPRPGWIWLLSSAQSKALQAEPWPQLALEAPAHGPGWTAFGKAFAQRWGYDPDLIAAAGYETARVLALTTAGAVPLASDGTRDPLAWLDPAAEPQQLCRAISIRRQGGVTRLEGVASDFALRPGQAPTGVADSRVIAAQ